MKQTESEADSHHVGQDTADPPGEELSEAAKRALREAEGRRRSQMENTSKTQEVGGRGGPDPVRYGDWEKNGIISDF